MSRRVLVFGGSGHVGRAVVAALRARGVEPTFTWHTRDPGDGRRIDLADPAAVEALVAEVAPDVLIHCAAIDAPDLDAVYAVNCRSAFVATHAMPAGVRDVVLLGGLDRTQSLPLPAAYAASQGMLSGMVMALARALGPSGLRINLLALGPLDGGLSMGLEAAQIADYQRFSALRRRGTAAEAAKAAVWLALENSYLNGKVVPVNGGI